MNSPMNITAEEWELIEAYLNQELASDNSISLRDKIVLIPNVEVKIDYIKKINEEIEDSIRKSKIKEFHGNIPVAKNNFQLKNETSRKPINTPYLFAIAAVLVVLFGIFWLMNINNPSDKIFAEHFTPDIGLPLKMSTTNSYDFYEGMLDYKQENYQEAIVKWKVLWEENPESDTLNYFLGVANLAQGNISKSLEYLENQKRFQQGIFKEDAAFYAALANIKKGNLEQAKELLQNNPSGRNKRLLNALLKNEIRY